MTDHKKTPIQCIGIICFKENDVLLIQRGKPPRRGEWSIPGGRIEPGESEIEACHRELFEETGIRARLIQKIACIPTSFDGHDYDLHDYLMIWESGIPTAGDDAMSAQFVDRKTLAQTQMWQKTHDIIDKALDLKKAVCSP